MAHFISSDICSPLLVLFRCLVRLRDLGQPAQVPRYYKSMTVCNSVHLNKGETNKKSLKWHVNWQTNCLICVCSVKGALSFVSLGAVKIYIWLEFNGPCRANRLVVMVTKLFSRFSTGQNVLFFFCSFEMCHVSQTGLGLVCINLFLLRGQQ